MQQDAGGWFLVTDVLKHPFGCVPDNPSGSSSAATSQVEHWKWVSWLLSLIAWGAGRTPFHIEHSIEISVERCLGGRGTNMGFLHRRTTMGSQAGEDGCPMDMQRRVFGIRIVETTKMFPHMDWNRMEPLITPWGIQAASGFFLLCTMNDLAPIMVEGIHGKQSGAARLYLEPFVPSDVRSNIHTQV